ncbi:MAG: biotin--[acetyl-CoA-carboxylase] ligase [Pseudomonadota bacterium]
MSIEWRVDVVGQAGSTQDIAHNKVMAGEEEGYVIQALQQTAGRGRHGNKWEAPMGNLYMSAVLRPDCSINDSGQIAFVVAVALSETLSDYLKPQHKKTLKWPNDVYIDGLKLSGILLENNLAANGSIDSLVMGIGVNIFKAPELAISLQDVTTKPVYVNVFRDEFLQHFSKIYADWQEKGFAAIGQAWLKEAHGLNEPMTVRLPDQSWQGIFKGIDERGALIVTLDNGEEKIIRAGDVHFGSNNETEAAN